MKKIIALILIAAGTIGIAAAQSKNQQNNPYEKKAGYNHQKDFDNSRVLAYHDEHFSLREKQALLQKINHEYDHRIADVKMNRYLRHREKKEQIKILESQRRNEIAAVQYRYERSNRHDVGFEKSDRRRW